MSHIAPLSSPRPPFTMPQPKSSTPVSSYTNSSKPPVITMTIPSEPLIPASLLATSDPPPYAEGPQVSGSPLGLGIPPNLIFPGGSSGVGRGTASTGVDASPTAPSGLVTQQPQSKETMSVGGAGDNGALNKGDNTKKGKGRGISGICWCR
ncbi:hypothetical protein D9758_009543 [Tetrapyrgos nigripes]|uniref:Uncharacterized protein n=1 Tax=Tetrapyrgos nigripes TaxID=182062 RepID=A0A8H5G134_9AGAR|nr:hypothetical protein D9758_009543 [Tetrapyrgos nigripes]